MKKILSAVLMLGIMLLFSSCTLNLGDTHIDLPWWAMMLLVVIPSTVMGLIIAWCGTHKNRNGIYVCPHCGHRFKPGVRILWSLHVMDEYLLRCPQCKKRDWCSLSYDQDE